MCVKVFRHIALHGEISYPSRGDVRHNSIISSFGEAINISNVSNVYRPAGRAIRFKLPVIVFRRLECHVLIGCIFNYPRGEATTRTPIRVHARPSLLSSSSFRAGVWEIKVDRRERSGAPRRWRIIFDAA